MITFETMSFAMILLIFLVAFFRILNNLTKKLYSLILNVLLGGGLYILFNLVGIEISLNYLTGLLTILLGVPGVCLIVILKVIFKIF